MDKQVFDDLAAQTHLQPRALKMAEAILCQGRSAAEVAKQEGVSRQLAEQAAKRIVQQLRSVDKTPDDWVTVTTTLPKPWAQLVAYIQTQEYAKAGLLTKSTPKVPEFEITDIAEFSKLVEEVLRKWRRLG